MKDVFTIILKRRYYYYYYSMGFPDSSVGKESACNAGDPSLLPGSERYAAKGRLSTPVFWAWRIAWTAYSMAVTKRRTQLSNFTFIIIISILYVAKIRLREAEQFVRGHTAVKWQNIYEQRRVHRSS